MTASTPTTAATRSWPTPSGRSWREAAGAQSFERIFLTALPMSSTSGVSVRLPSAARRPASAFASLAASFASRALRLVAFVARRFASALASLRDSLASRRVRSMRCSACSIGVAGAPGDARAPLGVHGGDHQAAEHAHVLEEVDLLLRLLGRVVLLPEPVGGGGRRDQGGGQHRRGQARQLADGQQRPADHLRRPVDADEVGVVGVTQLRDGLAELVRRPRRRRAPSPRGCGGSRSLPPRTSRPASVGRPCGWGSRRAPRRYGVCRARSLPEVRTRPRRVPWAIASTVRTRPPADRWPNVHPRVTGCAPPTRSASV